MTRKPHHPGTTEVETRTQPRIDAFAAWVRTAGLEPSARSRLEDALTLMLDVHSDQAPRPDGQPYVNHPLDVANWLVDQAGVDDVAMLTAALLHDTVEDQAEAVVARCGKQDVASGKQDVASNKQDVASDKKAVAPDVRAAAFRAIAAQFGGRTAELVDRLTHPPAYDHETDLQAKWRWYADHVRTLWEEDPDAAAIKLADLAQNAFRLDQIRDPGTRVKLAAKYRPALRVYLTGLRSLDDPSHPLFEARDTLIAQIETVYRRDYGRTLLIALPIAAFDLAEAGVVYRGTRFQPKDEVHITVIGKRLASDLEAAIARDPARERRIDLAVVEAPWYAPDWTYARTGQCYHVVKDKAPKPSSGRMAVLHAESIIERVHAPGVEAFFARLQAITGEVYEVPPLHVTLYTYGDPAGIALPDQAAFNRYVSHAIPSLPGFGNSRHPRP